MTVIDFEFDLEPVAKERPRARVMGKGPKAFATLYTPPKTKEYEGLIAKLSANQMLSQFPQGYVVPADQPVDIKVQFVLPRPKSQTEAAHCLDRRDVDNMLKSLLDGMQGAILEDDKCIVSISAKKVYTEETLPVGVYVRLTLLDKSNESIPVPKAAPKGRKRRADVKEVLYSCPECGSAGGVRDTLCTRCFAAYYC